MIKPGQQLRVSELDFETIKQNLITYFKNSETGFTDWDFEGSNLNTIIDLLAYNTHYNAMLAHMAVNESFIDSAQLRSSVVSAAKLLGYIPRSFSAAKATCDVTAIAANSATATSFVIPRGTVLSTTYDSLQYQFTVLDEVCVLHREGENYVSRASNPLIAYQGRLVSTSYQANAYDDGFRYEIGDANIDISTLKVTVYSDSNRVPGSAVVYRKYVDVGNVDATSTVYFINENTFGKYEISFGNGIFGKKLNSGNVIDVEYLVTDGSSANRINTPLTFTSLVNCVSGVAINQNGQRVSGGGDKENLDTLKQNALSSFATQNRAVTADDYRNLIISQFSNIKSVSVWGGEDNDPPIYGKVFICANEYASENQLTLSPQIKGDILQFLTTKKVLAIIPEIVDASYCNIVLDILVKYNPNISQFSSTVLQNKIADDVIDGYNQNVLNQFDSIFRHSQFVKLLDSYNSSFLNSLVRVYVSQSINVTQTQSNFMVDFGSPLHPDDGKVIISVYSQTPITENGEIIYIADEAESTTTRNVYIYTLKDSKQQRIRNIGTIDCETGKMTLSSLYSDEDVSLTFIVNPISNDIVGKRNSLLTIDTANSTVNIYPDEIARGGRSRTVDYVTFPKDRS